MKWNLIGLFGIWLGAAAAHAVTMGEVNTAIGAELWKDDNLWDDPDTEVAARLKAVEESRTPMSSSFRLYPEATVKIAGARPYSVAIYGEKGKPIQFSIIFANKGDYSGLAEMQQMSRFRRDDGRKAGKERERKEKALLEGFSAELRKDADTIQENLTKVLGEPKRETFGVGQEMKERVTRWDWNGHAFLLATPKGEYVGLRIMPTESANNDGRATRISDSDLKSLLLGRVDRRENGDVILKEIPMVDQGPKGFCVPATWERYLRYLGIPADMYVLAMAARTEMGGGTDIGAMTGAVDDLVRRYGRNVVPIPHELDVKNISKYIDDGLPLMWACFIAPQIEEGPNGITRRSLARKKNRDWDEWRKALREVRATAKGVFIDPTAGHQRMIIGYNKDTNELAISDSWGAWAEERWITVEEAMAISAGDLRVIKW